MNIQTLTIDNRDLPYTIDTYQLYNGDSTEEQEIDFTLEQYPELEQLLPENGGDLYIGFDYDHPAIVKDMAAASIDLIEKALQYEKVKVVHAIRFTESGSPDFYNYTTDHYRAEWDIDVDALDSVTPANWQAIAENDHGWDHDRFETREDNRLVAKLEIYLLTVLSAEDYESSMYEAESDCYYEHMEYNTETAALIDQIEKDRATAE